MSSKILFVFEGEVTEKKIAENLSKYFISENSVIQCAYCNNIYQLYKDISEDDDLDPFILLKEIPSNKEILSIYSREDFAEVYLFFDYDGHDTFADDNKVLEVLGFFNEETLFGRLYISYPMIESLRHYSELIDFKNLKVSAKENIRYKQIVNNEAKNELKQVKKYTKRIWIELIELHLKKMNYIVNDYYSLPPNNISQETIFLNQLEKFIKIDSTIAVLCAFPVFLFDYYGPRYINNLFEEP